MKKKVFVGLSGGVDSSVSAAILKEKGFEVTGVFIKVWHPDFLICNWRDEMRDAMRVCAKLEIPFLLCDLEQEYKTGVIDYMINEYKIGRTPNPDVMCNKEIKFKAFLNFALENGADYIATGHYAQVKEDNGVYKLLESEDKEKDQTYFLWNLSQEILEKTLFPVGPYKKEAVRKMASKFDLDTATKKDSQGLCFIGHVDMKDFLKKYLNTEPGDVLSLDGEIIGRHDGAILYTKGERHGFKITNQNDNSKPMYVVKKSLENNTISVSEHQPTDNDNQNVKLEKVNIIRPFNDTEILSRIRYRQELQEATIINKQSDNITLRFSKPQNYINSGQSIVFYKNGECLGGGIIK